MPSQSVSPVAREQPRRRPLRVLSVLLLFASSTVNGQTAVAAHDGNNGQGVSTQQPGSVTGIVIDVLNAPVVGAAVALQGPTESERYTGATDDSGTFEIRSVKPGGPYQLTIGADGFADWTSSVASLDPGEHVVLPVIELQIKPVDVDVTVRPRTSEEIATEQVHAAEKQREFGILPNFFEVFPSPDGSPPAPLTAKLKFSLAFKGLTDPVAVGAVGLLAGAEQAGGFLHFDKGVEGFGERFGASYANGFADIMIGSALLPTLLHQDPRYYYQGTGTRKSRTVHALSKLFIAKGDDGRLQPNYSMLGGDLASAALSNLYYPASNRGAGQMLQNFAIRAALQAGVGLLQEFVFGPTR